MLNLTELTRIWIGGTMAFVGFLHTTISFQTSGTNEDLRVQEMIRLGCSLSAIANGIFHMGLCLWTVMVGEHVHYPADSGFKDLSFTTGPFSDPGLQVKNILAIPISSVWLVWGYWIKKMDPAQRRWRRFLFPLIFLALGWLNPGVYPSFFATDQYQWPYFYVFFWVGIFWSETMSALFGGASILLVLQQDKMVSNKDKTE